MSEIQIPVVILHDPEGTAPSIDAESVARTMTELSVSPEAIGKTTIYVDATGHMLNKGMHYPKLLGKGRFWLNPDLRSAEGDIVRINTKVKNKNRQASELNRTLIHEMEHLAQRDRHDKKLIEGNLAIYGLALAGGIIGNRVGKGRISKAALSVLGAGIGHQLGYAFAPHEREARKRAEYVTTQAFSDRS